MGLPPNKRELLEEFRNRLIKLRVDPDLFFSETREIVVFGSRAAGVNRITSDLDVLCITGSARKVRTRDLDCICMTGDDVLSPYWQGCELASHIATYGVWITGCSEWRTTVAIEKAAIERKGRKLASLIETALSYWTTLHPLIQAKYRTTVRRELQRLSLLRSQVPIPPTPLLDARWNTVEISATELLKTAHTVLRNRSSSRWVHLLLEECPKL